MANMCKISTKLATILLQDEQDKDKKYTASQGGMHLPKNSPQTVVTPPAYQDRFDPQYPSWINPEMTPQAAQSQVKAESLSKVAAPPQRRNLYKQGSQASYKIPITKVRQRESFTRISRQRKRGERVKNRRSKMFIILKTKPKH